MPTNPSKSTGARKTTGRTTTPSVPTVTSAAEWKRKKTEEAGEVVQLPSGNYIKIRKGDPMRLLGLLRAGKVPNPLMPMISAMIMGQQPENVAMENFSAEDAMDTIDFMDKVAASMVIEPKVEFPPADNDGSWEPSEDAISIYDLDFMDRQFLFSVALGGPAELERFRELQATSLATAQDGGDLQHPTQPPAASGGRPLPSVVS